MYKEIIILIIFLGVIYVTIAIVRSQTIASIENNGTNGNNANNGNNGTNRNNNAVTGEPIQPKIIYRYIPRTLAEEEEQPVFASEIFETMFSQPSPWIVSVRNYDQRKQEKINKYFISQM